MDADLPGAAFLSWSWLSLFPAVGFALPVAAVGATVVPPGQQESAAISLVLIRSKAIMAATVPLTEMFILVFMVFLFVVMLT
jgi:hypothetical protein